MTRQLLCRECGEKLVERPIHELDRLMGWKRRVLYLSTIKPKDHGITVNRKFTPMADLRCDLCNKVITGEIAMAVSMWRDPDGFPNWETQYGTVLPESSVKMQDVLIGTKRKNQ